MYAHVFFDLDRTLWDFDRNSSETIKELFIDYQVEEDLGVDFQTFYKSFKTLNAISWREYKKGEQSKEELRETRFVGTYLKYGSGDWKKARLISRKYIEICPKKPHLIEGAQELLDKLKSNCQIHIITNGFSDSQRIKIKSSGLENYIDKLIISEETAYSKPQPEIFEHALSLTSAKAENSLMVGDDYRKDILGAMKAGWHQAYFNPENEKLRGKKPTYILKELSDLSVILG